MGSARRHHVATHRVLELYGGDPRVDARLNHLEARPEHVGLGVDELDVRGSPQLEQLAPDAIALLRRRKAAIGGLCRDVGLLPPAQGAAYLVAERVGDPSALGIELPPARLDPPHPRAP